jgi:hypothetical protein
VVVLVTVCVLAAGATAAFGTRLDSMFKTQNYTPDCHDDTSSTVSTPGWAGELRQRTGGGNRHATD